MARRSIAAILPLFFLFLPVLVLTGCSGRIPRSDNTTAAEELIQHRYTDEELEDLFSGEYGSFVYHDLRDFAKDYKIECRRNPGTYDESYLPYVVLMSESGKKLFIFYGDQKDGHGEYEIASAILNDSFFSYAEMQSNLKALGDRVSVYNRALNDCVEHHKTGSGSGEIHRSYPIAVKEGVLVIHMSKIDYGVYQFKDPEFYSDQVLFDTNSSDNPNRDNLYQIWPLLPIDKNTDVSGSR